MADWSYGDAYLDYPIEHGTAVFEDGSRLKAHDIFDPLPTWMAAEMVFTDAPWNQGNMTSFYTKAGMENPHRYDAFYARLFECIAEMRPSVCYLEIGKQHLADFVVEMRKIYPQVTFFNSTYYHREKNLCYVVRGGKKATRLRLDGMDEEDIISKVTQEEAVGSVADFCMGRGLVAQAAYNCGKQFYGTELNHKRLSVALKRLSDAGAKYRVEDA